VARAGSATLADHATQEAFEDALHGAPPWPGRGGSAWLRPLAAGGRQRFALAAGAGAGELAASLAAAALTQRLTGCSLWWAQGQPGAVESCTLVQGLPAADAFAALITGEW